MNSEAAMQKAMARQQLQMIDSSTQTAPVDKVDSSYLDITSCCCCDQISAMMA